MNIRRRWFPLLGIVFGGAGVVLCAVGILGIWRISVRLNGAVEQGFTLIDHAYATVQKRVGSAKQKINTAKMTSEDIEQGVRNWSKNRARERLAGQLGIDQKAERLAAGLREADHWLEFSEASVQLVTQALELANSIGVPVARQSSDDLRAEIALFFFGWRSFNAPSSRKIVVDAS